MGVWGATSSCSPPPRTSPESTSAIASPTKFYVVNDATQNLTYEYGANGVLVESYPLNGGNTAPAGAASTKAGDKTWVVDANRKVYVYDAAGTLLGSWTAGTLASTATVEGIATDGADVWIVDAKNDRVYRYAGAAATMPSGTVTAIGSFALNSSNKSPKDIVTDGKSLWVINDSTTDMVFKYTVAGSLLGSWTITSGGGSPTGITLDPSNVSHLWIVDSATDRVYQYDTAASQISGSKTWSTYFALAAGNTNPQGIADPPAPDGLFAVETRVPSTEAAISGNDAALASMYDEPLKKVRTDTARRSEVTQRWNPTPAISATPWVPPRTASRIDSVANDKPHTEVDDLFAQWESDPLERLNLPDLGM